MVVNVCRSLCLVVIIGLPIVTQKQNMNNASYALGTFANCEAVHSHSHSQDVDWVACSEWLARWLYIHSFPHLSPLDDRFVVISLVCLSTQEHVNLLYSGP